MARQLEKYLDEIGNIVEDIKGMQRNFKIEQVKGELSSVMLEITSH